MTRAMTDRAVVMLAVDPTHAEFVRGLVRDALKAAWDDGLVEGQPWGAVELLEDEQADLAYDLMARPEVGGGRHVVRLVKSQVNVEHSLVCRRAGLENCPVLSLVLIGLDAGHFDDETGFMVGGDLEVRMDAGTLLWGDEL